MIYLIRHAESVSNAGGKTMSDQENPLSETGRQQSVDLLQRIPEKPDLIIVSPYSRTQQTAEPLIGKYPDVPVEIWNVQEFTFLDTLRCKDTTHEERRIYREEYLSKNDHDFVHGTGAESFNQMLQRVDDALDRLKKMDENKFIVIFTHGHFIRATLARNERKNVTIEGVLRGTAIDNTDIIELAVMRDSAMQTDIVRKF